MVVTFSLSFSFSPLDMRPRKKAISAIAKGAAAKRISHSSSLSCDSEGTSATGHDVGAAWQHCSKTRKIIQNMKFFERPLMSHFMQLFTTWLAARTYGIMSVECAQSSHIPPGQPAVDDALH